MNDRGLSQISRPDLERLLQAIETGRVACPLTDGALRSIGFGAAADVISDALAEANRPGALAAVRAALAERTFRQPPRLELVWTGPDATETSARDTAVVLGELFQQARQYVLLAGYTFDHGEYLLAPLASAMKERGVIVDFFLDIPADKVPQGAPDAAATQFIDKFFIKNWTFGPPRPTVYYDPRTPVKGEYASLHAKVVVVDMRLTLVGSANFTERGQERNIETGVLIEDPGFAQGMVAQWRRLIGAGLVRRYGG